MCHFDLYHKIVYFISTNMDSQIPNFSFLLVFIVRMKETASDFSSLSNIASLNQ